MRRIAAAAALVVLVAGGAAIARAAESGGTPCRGLPAGVTSISPPPGFDPATATPQQLAQYGFPAHLSTRGDAADRQALARAQSFSCPAVRPSKHEQAH